MPWVICRKEPDLYFDIHSNACWAKGGMSKEEQEEWEARLKDSDVPIYCTADRVHLFKSGRAFPFDAVGRLTDKAFFENTIAYQLAFALWSHKFSKVDEVGLYGVNMMGSREYLWERASVTYWTGVLEGRGIRVTTPPGSALFMSYWMQGRYGETAEKRFAL
jgi:hypothetical protein